MSNRLRAALIGGGVMGGLSAVTVVPQIAFVRLACCIWAIVGGALAAYLLIKKSPERVSVGDGAIVGLLAGLFGALISFVAFMLVSFYIADRALYEDQLPRAGLDPEQFPYSLIILLIGFLAIIMQVALSLVGGIIGIALFESRGVDGADVPPPPPPPSYGGAPSETFAAPPNAPQEGP